MNEWKKFRCARILHSFPNDPRSHALCAHADALEIKKVFSAAKKEQAERIEVRLKGLAEQAKTSHSLILAFRILSLLTFTHDSVVRSNPPHAENAPA